MRVKIGARRAVLAVAALVGLMAALGADAGAQSSPFEVPVIETAPSDDPPPLPDFLRGPGAAGDESHVHVRGLVQPPPAVFDSPTPRNHAPMKSPFAAGERWRITSDERNPDGSPHASLGPLAFDLVNQAGRSGTVLAVADGKARKACLTQNQAIVLLDVAGHGRFQYVHLDKRTLPAWLRTDGWTDVKQGERLGDLWLNNRPGLIHETSPDGCQMWTNGPHLHFELPSIPQTLDGRMWSRAAPNRGAIVTSTNGATQPPPVTAKCHGRTVTINMAVRNGIGTAGDDVILGTDGPDVIEGRGGNDIICGGGGNDVIRGNQGADILIGGPGNDRLEGGLGPDQLHGLVGDDVLIGNEHNDRLFGGVGRDRGFGGPGNDTIFGGPGGDTLEGGLGDDEIHGHSENDVLRGNQGNDRLFAGTGWDRAYGGWGNDIIHGGWGNDLLHGEPGADTLYGGNHADTLNGGPGGPDRCYGQAGTGDRLTGGCEVRGGIP